MNYQIVSSTDEGRGGLIHTLGVTSFVLLAFQFFLWPGIYESRTGIIMWQGVGLGVFAGILAGAWLAVLNLFFDIKEGQGSQTTADFGHGIVAIKRDGLWGVFSAEAEELFLPFEFTFIGTLQWPGTKPKYLKLEKSGMNGLYSILEWRLVIPVQFKRIVKLNNDLCAVQGHDDRWGMFSLERDRLVMPVEYPNYKEWGSCRDFIGVPDSNDSSRKWAVFSIANQAVVTPYSYDNIQYLGNGVFTLQQGQRKRRSENNHLRFGLYIHRVDMLIEPEYTSIESFLSGLLKLQARGRIGLLSTETGKILIPVECWSLRILPDKELEVVNPSGKLIVDLGSLKAA